MRVFCAYLAETVHKEPTVGSDFNMSSNVMRSAHTHPNFQFPVKPKFGAEYGKQYRGLGGGQLSI